MAASSRLLTGVCASKGGPRITHLFFADDSLIFVKASTGELVNLLNLLRSYELASGQCLNYDKSAMVFSENVSTLDCQVFGGLCGIKIVKEHKEYLGLPTNFGKKKKAKFTRTVERVSSNTKGWKEKSLSVVGKEILIKAVAQAIPNYAMGCFLLPKGVCEDIEKIIRDFWWGDTKEKRKVHWISWDNLKMDKDEGGMGFKDLRSFNIAMLAKQACRLLTNPDTLLGSIYSHKYYRLGNILSAKSSDRISFGFRSVLEGCDLLERGLFWRIGDGRSVECFRDRWIPRPYEYRPITTILSAHPYRVSDFILDGCWDEFKLKQFFLEADYNLIRNIPLPMEESPDELVWLHSQTGIFTVKSGYKLHRSIEAPQPENSAGLNRQWLRCLWKLNLPRKVFVPIWRAWKDSLPVAANVRRRGLNVCIDCSFCGNEAESSDHLFLNCPRSIGIWQDILPSHGRREDMSSFKEWIEHVFTTESLAFRQAFAVSTWMIWFKRNKIRFEGETFNHDELTEAIQQQLSWFLQGSTKSGSSSGQPLTIQALKPPEEGWVKVNSDASVVHTSGKAGLGCVIRNEAGDFVCGKSLKQPYNQSTLLLELRAIKMGLELAKDAGCRKVVAETDCLVAFELLTSRLPAEDGRLSGEIKEVLDFCRSFSPWFEGFSVSHTRRTGNEMAHAFAKFAIDIESPMLFFEKPNWAIEHLYGFFEPVGV